MTVPFWHRQACTILYQATIHFLQNGCSPKCSDVLNQYYQYYHSKQPDITLTLSALSVSVSLNRSSQFSFFLVFFFHYLFSEPPGLRAVLEYNASGKQAKCSSNKLFLTECCWKKFPVVPASADPAGIGQGFGTHFFHSQW